MADGIKLEIVGDDVVVDSGREKQRCFGSVMCGWLEKRPYQATLSNGMVVDVENWHCLQSNCRIDEFCPLGLWQKMAAPIGSQNVFRGRNYVLEVQNLSISASPVSASRRVGIG